jgi:glutamine cyclotransferase
MTSFKKIGLITIIVAFLAALILPNLFSDKDSSSENKDVAHFLFKENLAVHIGNKVPIEIEVNDSEVSKIEVTLQDSILKTWMNPGKKLKFQFDASKFTLGAKDIKLLVYKQNKLIAEDDRLIRILSDVKPMNLNAYVVSVQPHNPTHFTQGLEYNEGILYESTGQNGASIVAKINPSTGAPSLKIGLDENYFGEGITVFKDLVYQLTWREQKCFVYSKNTLQLIKDISYSGEGWGLCNNGKELIMSDGSERLYFRDPTTFEILKTIEVYDHQGPRIRLNELEYIKGKIYANVWMENIILIINPSNGKVEGEIHCDDVVAKAKGMGEVLNGIAYQATTKKLYLTGKNWEKIAEVTIK